MTETRVIRHEAASGAGLRGRNMPGAELRGDLPAGAEVRMATELRAADGGGNVIEGYAAVYDEETRIGGPYGFIEVLSRGAFDKVLASEPDVRFLFDHDGLPLARTAAGTMTLRSDAKGLAFSADLGSSPYAQSVLEAIQRGDLSQCSFAFTVGEERWINGTGGAPDKRHIDAVSGLFDASTVTYPAYDGTSVAARSLVVEIDNDAQTLEAVERKLLADAEDDELDDAEARANAFGLKLKTRLAYAEALSKS